MVEWNKNVNVTPPTCIQLEKTLNLSWLTTINVGCTTTGVNLCFKKMTIGEFFFFQKASHKIHFQHSFDSTFQTNQYQESHFEIVCWQRSNKIVFHHFISGWSILCLFMPFIHFGWLRKFCVVCMCLCETFHFSYISKAFHLFCYLHLNIFRKYVAVLYYFQNQLKWKRNL